MFKISILIAVLAGLLAMPWSASAEDEGPKEAKTTAEIVKAVEKIHVGMAIGGRPDEVNTAEFRTADIKVFVAWHSPFSGFKGCCAYLYVFDEEKKVWKRQMSETFENTNDLSVKFGNKKVTLRDESGKVVYEFKQGAALAEDKREQKTRAKGVELYSWKDKDGNWLYVLATGTNKLKTEKQIKEGNNLLKGSDELKKALALLAEGEQVGWLHSLVSGFEFPPENTRDDIKKAAKEAKVDLIIVLE